MSAKITPFIRCMDTAQAQPQAEYYCTIFPGAKITSSNVAVVEMEIFGQSVSLLNGGENDNATLNPSISFSLWIRDLEIAKQIREKLSDGGMVMMPYDAYPRSEAYGRCNDKYGVSRQVMYDNHPDHTADTLIPSLMYVWANNGKTQEAIEFYTGIFPASSIVSTRPYGENEMGENPKHLNHAEFTLWDQLFIAMDSGLEHKFTFNDGVSLAISCADQAEVDYYREKLILDGWTEVACGRGKDKYGVSRQIVPVWLAETVFHSDKTKADYAMKQIHKMKKIVIADLTE